MSINASLLNHSLIAPLDALRFALAYLLLVVAPGYALATLLRVRSARSERLALAVPCAYTLVAVSGLTTALLHTPYTLLSYGVLALPVTLAGAYAGWRKRQGPKPVEGRWWLVAAGVALVQAIVIALVFVGYVVPPGGDAVVHIYWTNLLAHSHTFPIALLSSASGVSSTDGGFYPPVFHVLTALLLGIAPMPAYHAVFFNMAAAVVVLPLALFAYVRVATGSARVGACAAVVSLAFDPLPFYIPTQGMYTLVVSQVFVPALAITLRDALGRGERRAVVLAALLGVGLFYTHPTEFVTVALLTLAIVPDLLRTGRTWLRATGYGVLIAAVWGLAALPAVTAIRRTMVAGAQKEISSSHYFVPPLHPHIAAVLDGYVQDVYGRNMSYVLLALVVVGAVWSLGKRRLLGLVAAQGILTLLFIDATGYDVLHGAYVVSFPWALWERLAATHYWFALPLAALGIDAAVRAARRLAHARSRPFALLIAAPVMAFGLLLPLTLTVERVAAFTHAHVVMAPADLGAVAWLARHAPKGSVVVNDSNLTPRVIYDAPIDAGLWMPDMGGPQPLFWRGEEGPGTLADRNYLVEHIANAPLPPRAARFVAQHHVYYVFYGAGIRITAQRHLNLGRLLTDPRIHLVYASTPCRHNGQQSTMSCPPAGASYVFALNANADLADVSPSRE